MIGAARRKKDTSAAPPYLSHFGLREAPFANGGARFFYAEPDRAQALNMLLHLSQYSEELLLVTGPLGAGKTTLLEQFLARADEGWQVCRIGPDTAPDAGALFLYIAQCFGLDTSKVAGDQVLEALRGHLDAMQTSALAVLVVDDAHALSDDALEIVVRLADLEGEHGKLVRTVLFAERTLPDRLQLPRFSSAPTPHRLDLKPLDEQHTAAYIHHRLHAAGGGNGVPLSARQVRRIHKGSRGWPGAVNRLADEALVERMQAERPNGRGRLVYLVLFAGAAVLAAGFYAVESQMNALFEVDDATSAVPLPAAERPASEPERAEPPSSRTIVRREARPRPASGPMVLAAGDRLEVVCSPASARPQYLEGMGGGSGPATESTPARRDMVAEAPADESPTEEAPTEETPTEEAPAEEAPTEEAPTEEAPTEEASTEEAPAEEAPAEEAPAEEAPAEEAPTEEAPTEEAPTEEAPTEEAPTEEAPTEEAPTEEAPTEEAPTKEAPAPEPPRIAAVAPDPVTGSWQEQSLTVTGQRFTRESRVEVAWDGERVAVPTERTEFIGPGRLRVRVTTGVEQDTWRVWVVDPEAGRSEPYRLAIEAAPQPPRVAAVEPAPVPGSWDRQTLTVTGERFVPESTVQVAWNGKRTTIPAERTEFVDSRHLRVRLTPGTTPDTWRLWVTHPERGRSEPFRFRIAAPEPAAEPAAPGRTVGDDWLWGRDPGHITVQLVAAHEREAVLSYLDGHAPKGPRAIYRTVRDGEPWWVLVWGDFADKPAARRAITRLSGALRRTDPWVRSFASVHEDLQRADSR